MSPDLAGDLATGLDPARLLYAFGLVPEPWQEGLLRQRPGRALVCCCRQAGKSTAAAAAAAHEALYSPGSLSLIVAPSQRQSNELLRVVRGMLAVIGPPRRVSGDAQQMIELRNGSRVVSLPGRDDTIRGFASVALLALDEAAWIEDELYYAVRPMLAVSGGRLLALSTPNGQRGWFYREWETGQGWQRTRISASQCSRIPAAFLAEERRAMTAVRYAAEYECEFSDAIDAVFRTADINATLDPELPALPPQGW